MQLGPSQKILLRAASVINGTWMSHVLDGNVVVNDPNRKALLGEVLPNVVKGESGILQPRQDWLKEAAMVDHGETAKDFGVGIVASGLRLTELLLQRGCAMHMLGSADTTASKQAQRMATAVTYLCRGQVGINHSPSPGPPAVPKETNTCERLSKQASRDCGSGSRATWDCRPPSNPAKGVLWNNAARHGSVFVPRTPRVCTVDPNGAAKKQCPAVLRVL